MKNKAILIFAIMVTTLGLFANVRNVAPVLDTSYDPVLVSIQEGNLDSSGDSVIEIVDPNSITDGDGGVSSSIAVTEVDNTNGLWQYSLNNGTSWHNFSNITGSIVNLTTQARLLNGSLTGTQTNRIRFVPEPDYPDTLAWTPPDIPYDGSAYFKFRAWDRDAGITGLTADASVNGGSTSFSSAEDIARITILAVNDDPALYFMGQEVTGVTDLGFSIDEDTSYHFQSGELYVDDPDIGNNQIIFDIEARKGILNFANVGGRFISGNGTSNVTIVTDLTELNSILEDSSFYFPNQDENHTEVLTVRLNDQFWSGIGGGEDIVRRMTFWINPVNDAPVLNTSFTPRLSAIDEDAIENNGNSISSIIPDGSIYDVDTTAVEAIAVISVDNSNGIWEYSTDNGNNWQSISNQTGINHNFETNALLLDGELTGIQTQRMRFIPNLDFYGTATFAFRAWDKTDGFAMSRINATVNGDTMSISSAYDNALISVSSINDVPAVYYRGNHEADTLQVYVPITSPMQHTFSDSDSLDIFDPDIGTNVMMLNIIAQKGTMTFHGATSRYISNNGTGNVTITGNLSTINNHLDNVTYSVPAGEEGYDFVDFVMSDFGYSGAGASQTIHNMIWIQLTNEPPTYSSSPITTAHEDSFYEYTITTADADTNRVFIDTSVLPDWLTIVDNGDNTATLSGTPTNDNVGANPVTIEIWDWVTPDTPVLQQFVINVINTNDAPRFTSSPVLQVDEGSLYQYFVTAEDVDGGSSLTLNASVIPTWLSFTDNGDGTGLLTGTPLNIHVGFHPITLTLTDGIISSTVSQNFNIEVIDVNSPPFVTVPIPDQNTTEDFTPNIVIDLRNHFDDVDPNTTLAFSAQSVSSQIRANVVGSELILSPAPDFFGSTDVTVTADDQHASGGVRRIQTRDRVSDTFTVNLSPVNDAPRFVSTPITIATENVVYTYNCQAIEVDPGDPITLSATSLPSWLAFTDLGNGRGRLTGTPGSTELGIHSIVLSATDNIAANPTEQNFDVYVNSIPVFDSSPITSVNEDELYSYNIVTSDDNPDAVLNITTTNLPTWLTLTDNGDGTAILSGTPTNEFVGINQIELELSDGYVTSPVVQAFDIDVINMNDAPYFTSTPLLISNVNQPYLYNITVADDDPNPTLTITSSVLPGWLTFVDNGDGTAILSGTPQISDAGQINVSLFVTDGFILNPVEQDFILEVREPNTAPYFASDPQLSALQDQLYTYNIIVEDNNTWATITVSDLLIPSWCSLTDNGDGTAVLSGTPDINDLGAHDVILEASDGIITTPIQQVFTVTVYDQNTPPTITSVPITDAIEDQLYQYTLVATDPNFWANLTITASTLPSWLVLTDNGDGTALLEGTPLNENVGSNPIVLEVTDGVSPAVQQNFTINVTNTNDIPVFTSTPVTTTREGFNYIYNISVNDVDSGATLTLNGDLIPVWLNFTDNGDGTGLLTGTPDGTDLGNHNVVLSVTDGIIATPVRQNFVIDVEAYNYAPVFTSTPVTTATEDMLYTYNITAADPNTWAILDISATVYPVWLSFTDNGDGTAILTGTPGDSDIGQNNVTLTLTDHQIATPVVQSFVINVSPINDQPTFDQFPTDITINELELYQADIVASDPDGPSITLTATTIPTWLSFTDNGNGNGQLTGTPNGDNLGDNLVTLRASDGIGGNLEQSFTITVNQFNYPPSFTSQPTLTVLQGNEYSYNVVTQDPNTWAVLTLSATTIPAWLSLTDNGDGTGLLTGTPSNQEVGMHQVSLEVSDSVAPNTIQAFTIEVINVNDGPVLSVPLADVNDTEDFTNQISIDLDQHFTDVDGNPLDYSQNSNSDEINASITGSTLTLTSVADWYGTTSITVTADDLQNRASVNDSFDVILTPVNDAPVFITTNDTLATVNDVYTYNISVSDPDPSDTVTFSTNNMPAWLSFTDNLDRTGTITGTPQSTDYGVYDFSIDTSDGIESATQNIHIRVFENNSAPVFTSTPVTQVMEDNLYDYSITVTDANTWATLAITGEVIPAWLTFTDNGDGTAELTGTPENENVGLHNVSISVSDGIASPVLQNFTIEVINVNDDPELIVTFSDMVENEDFTEVSIDLSTHFSDPDGDQLVYSVSSQSDEISTSVDGDQLVLNSVSNWFGNTVIHVSASDQLSPTLATDSFIVTVNPVNDEPIFSSEVDTLANVGELYSYETIVTDYDESDIITFNIIGVLPDWLTFTPNTDRTALFEGTPQSADYGVYGFTLQASDGFESIYQDVNITVWEENYLPVFDSEPILEVQEDNEYIYNIVVTDQNAWNTILFSYNIPEWLSFTNTGNGLATLSGTPTNEYVGTWDVAIMATDRIVDVQIIQSFQITVENVNDAPYIYNTFTPIVVDEDFVEPLTYNLLDYFRDDDIGDSLSFTLSMNDEIPIIGAVIEGNVLTITPVINACGLDTLTISANDENSSVRSSSLSKRLAVSLDVLITINPINDNPILVTEIDDFSMDENTIDSHIDLAIHFNDVDIPYGDILEFTHNDPDNISLSLVGSTLVIEPLLDWYGTDIITVSAKDEFNNEVNESFEVTVLNVSDIPIIEEIDNQFIQNSIIDSFQYQVIYTAYPNIDFTLENAPDGMTINASGLISWTPSFDQYGSHEVTVKGSNVAGTDSQVFTVRVINDAYGPENIKVSPLSTGLVSIQWSEPPTTAWVTGYKLYSSNTYDGVYVSLANLNSEELIYQYEVNDKNQTIYYRVTAVIDADIWQGETNPSEIVTTHILDEGETTIANDDGTLEGNLSVEANTQLGVSYELHHRSEFELTKVALYITEVSTDDLTIEFSDEGDLPDNEVSGISVTYQASDVNLGWNFLSLPEDVNPSFTGSNFFVRVIGTPDPWGIGLDKDTNGNTFRKAQDTWGALLTGNSMVRAIVKQLDALIVLSANTHDFGLIYTNDKSMPFDIDISNNGNKALEINSIKSPQGYEIKMSDETDWKTSIENIVVDTDLSVILQIRFVPTDDKSYVGDIEISSNSSVNPDIAIEVRGISQQSEPNAFTPNGDSKNDVFKFKVISDSIERVKMTVYNLNGRKIYSVEGQSSQPLQWDGKNDSGDKCKSGPYLFVIERAGKTYKRGKIYLVK